MNAGRTFAIAICVILAGTTSSLRVLGQTAPSAESSLTDSGEHSPPLVSEATGDQSLDAGCRDSGCCPSCCCPRWTASADFIILDRVGSVTQTLIETVPHSVRFKDLPNTPGTEVLDANDFHQGFSGGPRLGLIHHDDNGGELEFSYFQVDGWNDYRSVGPTPDYWLVMRAPGGFLQAQDNKNKQMMTWDYASRLYNAELNVRWNSCCRVTLLAGFRWVNLSEDLQGNLPPERTVPFWDSETRNNFYGFQIGADARLFERDRLSIGGVVKAGMFDNRVDETTAVSIDRIVYSESASTNHAAFVGEIGLQCKYQVSKRLLLKAGYEALWLEGAAFSARPDYGNRKSYRS